MGRSAEGLDAMAHLVRHTSPEMTALQRMEGLRRVNARLEVRKRRRFAVIALSGLGGVAAIATALLVVPGRGPQHGGNGSMTYSIQGGEIGDGGYIRSFAASGSLLHFEEGSELRLMAGARGRLGAVDAHGARFAIEEGEAEVKVTPRPGARWLVDAGPFLITVHGTAFTASWNGATERLDIHMKKGLVSVTGPLADGIMAVRPGQHLMVNIKKNEVVLRPIDGDEGPGEPPRAEVAPRAVVRSFGGGPAGGRTATAPAGGVAPSLARSSSSAAAGTAPRSWAAALAAGDLDAILADAERRGVSRAIAEANSEDLAVLADAARYRRRDTIARQALLAARERFPRSERASDSAFLLGRLEESRPAGEARALRWYDLYLKEAPSGAYSSEALGRKMMAIERTRGVVAAREVAGDYLRRFPDGSYAGAARALRDAP